ncbi:MAG: hypothetical protein ACLQBX_09725 [Candidatus Limnocylindrales bacterium]|jgi:hypothetical protein
MDPKAFQVALDSWHDFYLATASAAAALLGLLFVGVSINLASITAAERVDLRTRANLAFSNLLYLLGLSLIVLVPGSDAAFLAISFTVIAGLGLLRIVRRVVVLLRANHEVWKQRDTLRHLGWTFIADLLLLCIAATLASSGDPQWLLALTIVVFVLLIGAADVAWGLLVRESEEARRSG